MVNGLLLFFLLGVKTHFLFEQVLPVLERAQLDLPLLVLQLHVRQLEIGDEVVEGLEHFFDGQRDHGAVLKTQTIQVSGRKRQREYRMERGEKKKL